MTEAGETSAILAGPDGGVRPDVKKIHMDSCTSRATSHMRDVKTINISAQEEHMTAQTTHYNGFGNGARTVGSMVRSGVEAVDRAGPAGWIGLMVLGFVFGGPLGLVVLFFALATGRFWRRCGTNRVARAAGAFRSSGNMAFDAYKEETLRRLEEEQENFEAFLERLREAKDKAEFDQFMEDRARKARDASEPVEA